MNSKAYAKLIVDTFPKYINTFLKDFKKLNDFLQKPDINSFFSNILISNKDKKEVLEKITKNFSKESKNLLLFLAERRRYDIILSLYEELRLESMRREGVVKGELIFPNKPSKKIVKTALSILKDIAKTDVDYEVLIDKEIIGGFIFKSEKFIADLSVKYQLEKLKETVLG
jgi:F-type H+-transporting ATPase subunit delta